MYLCVHRYFAPLTQKSHKEYNQLQCFFNAGIGRKLAMWQMHVWTGAFEDVQMLFEMKNKDIKCQNELYTSIV